MITFEVIKESTGNYNAACYEENIYTDGESLQVLHDRITAEIERKFSGRPKPASSDIKLLVWSE